MRTLARRLPLIGALALASCAYVTPRELDRRTDQDGDGFVAVQFGGADCDDTDAEVYPAAVDVPYDGVDADCGGGNDYDRDGDGVEPPIDCDDEDPTVFPAAEDPPYDGVDADCAGDNDFDRDGDAVEHPDDCDDTDAATYPGAPDAPYDGVDAACDGDAHEWDLDGDGFDGGPDGVDCADDRPAVHPDATEIWYDGVDQDCDGNDCDADLDGFDAENAACGGDDCDDTDDRFYPGAPDLPIIGVADCAFL